MANERQMNASRGGINHSVACLDKAKMLFYFVELHNVQHLSFFIARNLNLYKNTTNIYGCGIFVQGNIQKL